MFQHCYILTIYHYNSSVFDLSNLEGIYSDVLTGMGQNEGPDYHM